MKNLRENKPRPTKSHLALDQIHFSTKSANLFLLAAFYLIILPISSCSHQEAVTQSVPNLELKDDPFLRSDTLPTNQYLPIGRYDANSYVKSDSSSETSTMRSNHSAVERQGYLSLNFTLVTEGDTLSTNLTALPPDSAIALGMDTEELPNPF